ncbi:MAG: hypothetical protein RLZZ144_362 [Pseudomonadota bacterium]|jgi:membrane protein YqaA with SNARE-associated domain
MEFLTQFFSHEGGLWGLFIASLLGATLLPGGSELVLVGVLKSQPDSFYLAIFVGTLGNTLGGMISFGMGWMLPQTQQLKHVDRVRRYGVFALLFAWAPLIGDAICVAAGWLRLNIWQAAMLMALGKFLRYSLIAYAIN